jgi:hypothetical protein
LGFTRFAAAALPGTCVCAVDLESSFSAPPADARLWVYRFWLNGTSPQRHHNARPFRDATIDRKVLPATDNAQLKFDVGESRRVGHFMLLNLICKNVPL